MSDVEIVALMSIVNHQKTREKRGIKSTVLCPIGACAYDTKESATLPNNKKPANCEDLKTLSHTFSGFYLVQGKRDKITLKSKVETIYCDFNKRPSPGNQAGTTTESVNVNFQVERLNQGGAMDLSSGVFTAPIPGTYFFLFSAVKGRSWGMGTEVYIYHNEELIGTAYGAPSDRPVLMLQSLFELKSGDKVRLVKGQRDDIYAASALSADGNNTMTTHFTGWLLDSGF